MLKGNGFDELDVLLEVKKDHLQFMEVSVEDQQKLLEAIKNYQGKVPSVTHIPVLPTQPPSMTPENLIRPNSGKQNIAQIADEKNVEEVDQKSKNTTPISAKVEPVKRPQSGLSSTNDTRVNQESFRNLGALANKLVQSSTAQTERADFGEKVSCWNCYAISMSETCIREGNKFFCSDTCFKKSQGEYKTRCAKCGVSKLKRESLLFDSLYYCSKECKPAIEDLASKLAKFLNNTVPVEETHIHEIICKFDKESKKDAPQFIPEGSPLRIVKEKSITSDLPVVKATDTLTPDSVGKSSQENPSPSERPQSILRDKKQSDGPNSARARSNSKKRVSFRGVEQNEAVNTTATDKPSSILDSTAQSAKILQEVEDEDQKSSSSGSLTKLQEYKKNWKESRAQFSTLDEYVREHSKKTSLPQQSNPAHQSSCIDPPRTESRDSGSKGMTRQQSLNEIVSQAPKIKQMANAFFKRTTVQDRTKELADSKGRKGVSADKRLGTSQQGAPELIITGEEFKTKDLFALKATPIKPLEPGANVRRPYHKPPSPLGALHPPLPLPQGLNIQQFAGTNQMNLKQQPPLPSTTPQIGQKMMKPVATPQQSIQGHNSSITSPEQPFTKKLVPLPPAQKAPSLPTSAVQRPSPAPAKEEPQVERTVVEDPRKGLAIYPDDLQGWATNKEEEEAAMYDSMLHGLQEQSDSSPQ